MSTDDQTDPRGVQRNRPETVGALASTVISVLRERQAVSHEGLRQFVLDHLVRAVLAHKAFDAGGLLTELRGYRIPPDALIDLYVPAAARILGEQWAADQISFADVTIGTMRLQSLLELASVQMPASLRVGEEGPHTLVLVPSGEQHFLGACVVAAQLRRLGCEVTTSFDEDHGTLTTRLMQDPPDLVLVTCSRFEQLETISQTVQIIANAVPRRPLIALGGAAQLNNENMKDIAGVDIITSIASEALAFCVKQTRLQTSL